MFRHKNKNVSLGSSESLHFKSYTSKHIASTLCHVASLRPPNLLSVQEQALSTYYHRLKHTKDFSLSSIHVSDPSSFLKQYFDLFNKLYFLNALEEQATLYLSLEHEGATGHASHTKRDKNDKNKVVMVLFNRGDKSTTSEQWLRSFVGNLLHEIIQAFFDLYVCTCSSCNLKIFENCGKTGHGVNFLDVANTMELSAESKRMLCLELDLGFLGGKIPGDEQLDAWDMDREDPIEAWEEFEEDWGSVVPRFVRKGKRRGRIEKVLGRLANKIPNR
ncbi:hypothetical protein B0J14DRAFT_632402 [Halenospora varia]|nr:hypothetical protein B0J14DRAFT_632402 [Halenospora varia]